MIYPNVVKGTFLNRPNRFIAEVEINGKKETVHVKNTGRCKELLISGITVYLTKSGNPARKTKYDLIAVEKQRQKLPPLLVNIDSQAANDVAAEWLKNGTLFPKSAIIRREVKRGKSRFDFCIECEGKTSYLEVKGVTLEEDGVARFPDAPTERGVKHVRELIDCTQNGHDAYILFVIQMKEIQEFCPNDQTHPAFGEALREAKNAGVRIIAMDCIISQDRIEIDAPVSISL